MSKILATGHYLPPQVLSNEDLIQAWQLDSSDDWIQTRSGIQQRHFALEGQSVGDLAVQAALNLFDKLDSDLRGQVQLIIVASMSSYAPTPGLANLVQAALGLDQAQAFDLNTACSGFVTALDTAVKLASFQESGYTLVIGAEKMSQILDPQDRSTCVLFGDGAGAVLLANDGQVLTDYASRLQSMASGQESIQFDGRTYLEMAGRPVFNFVNRTVVGSLKTFIDAHHLEDFDYLLCHQANQRLLDIITRKLKLDPEQVPSNISQVANLSAASLPVLMDQLVEAGTLRLGSGQKVILAGYGGGLTWGEIAFTL
ncbi:beta-ketoacyl-ACP synthase 3 [Hutsoniella sourekii]